MLHPGSAYSSTPTPALYLYIYASVSHLSLLGALLSLNSPLSKGTIEFLCACLPSSAEELLMMNYAHINTCLARWTFTVHKRTLTTFITDLATPVNEAAAGIRFETSLC